MKKLLLASLFLLYGCDKKETTRATSTDAISKDILQNNLKALPKSWSVVNGEWGYKDGVFLQSETDNSYNVIINKNKKLTNLKASVEFMPLSGKWDASGGIIFRVKDKDNYYILRANALEDNLSLYTYVNGSRHLIKEVRVKAPSLKEWHSIKVVVKGNLIEGYLDGKLYLTFRDSTFKSGYTGLWTKADSVTKFKNFIVEEIN